MKSIFFSVCIAIVIFSTYQVEAAEKTIRWYEGMARIIDLTTGIQRTDPLLVQKTIDPNTGYIIEIACFQGTDKKVRLFPVYMKVNGNKLVISNNSGEPKFLSGTGEVFGENWNWSYLKFSMEVGPVRIEDANFVVPGKLIARKQIFIKNTNTPVQLWDVEMTELHQDQFLQSSERMGCPEAQSTEQ